MAWGTLNAIYFLPLLLMNKNRSHIDIVAKGKFIPTLKEFASILITFGLTVIAWIVFRADNIKHAGQYFISMFDRTSSYLSFDIYWEYNIIIILISVFLLVEWIGREDQYAIEKISLKLKTPLRYALYYTIIFAILWFGGQEQTFIYFQF